MIVRICKKFFKKFSETPGILSDGCAENHLLV